MANCGMPKMNPADSSPLVKVEYFQGLYPCNVKRLHLFVIEACDEMDFQGSPIYDQYPDRLLIDQMVSSICCRIPKEVSMGLEQTVAITDDDDGIMDEEEVEVYEAIRSQELFGIDESYRRRPGPPPWGPPSWDGPSWDNPSWYEPSWDEPERPRSNWLNDMVRVLLLHEIHRRNCGVGFC